ncbi:flgN protein [bacterium BMS3Abin04]|nr:flgN protein [bacterium BMS3Abin04]
MKVNKLTIVLNEQQNNLSMLLEIIKNKQKALVERDDDSIKLSVKREEKILLKIQSLEEKRISAIETVYTENNLSIEDYRITTLLQSLNSSLDKKTIEVLSDYKLNIKNLILEIMKLNQQNMFLIQHTRQFFSETINAILSSTKRSLIDRKG